MVIDGSLKCRYGHIDWIVVHNLQVVQRHPGEQDGDDGVGDKNDVGHLVFQFVFAKKMSGATLTCTPFAT